MFRMSGSGGGMGATIRIYAESFERDPERQSRETQVPLESDAVSVSLNEILSTCAFMTHPLLFLISNEDITGFCFTLKYFLLVQNKSNLQYDVFRYAMFI